MDWQVLNLSVESDSIFLDRASQQIVAGIDKLKQQVAIRLLQGFKRTSDEYDIVAGGLSGMIRSRLEPDVLKMRIAILIDSVKEDMIESQQSLDVPDDEALYDLRARKISIDSTEATIDIAVFNKAGATGLISI